MKGSQAQRNTYHRTAFILSSKVGKGNVQCLEIHTYLHGRAMKIRKEVIAGKARLAISCGREWDIMTGKGHVGSA